MKKLMFSLVIGALSFVSAHCCAANEHSKTSQLRYESQVNDGSTVEEKRLWLSETLMPEITGRWLPKITRFDRQWQSTSSLNAAQELVRSMGNWLWLNSKNAMKTLKDWDDRPTYWARLQLSKIIHTKKPNFTLSTTEQTRLLELLEEHSRGRKDLNFTENTPLKILVTGFDPFLLDKNIKQGNPSGVAALALDGKVIEINGLQAEINTVLVPVRWQDFDAGEIERLLTPFYQTNAVDMIVTISQGRSEFDLERFPARRRSSLALDNLRGFSGGTAENPLPVTLNGKLLKGEEFVEFSLPAAAMMRAKGKYKINDNDKVTTLQKGQVSGLTLTDLQKMTAVAGSGGGYMSNEISYRSIRLRNELHSSIPTGHIHTPIVAAGDQAAMAQVVEQIENMLIMALPTLENNVSVN